ncbi:MAG: AAA family ATPase [Sulfuritalea sp.]|nr:AAA family ATPase [Sulfuritalea sp.]
MTLLEPCLAINCLVVRRNGHAVVNIQFHRGLNILRGENSAGKTTIVRFLAYALGAENVFFNQTALLCSETYLEISVNGAVLTLRRNITATAQQPLAFYWGAMDEAIDARAENNWQVFPFRRSESKESFSQILFRLLGMPELRGDSGSNITMHQLSRLLYSDQERPSGELFRAEKFDPAITRAAVGDYLLGIDSNELYELRLRQTTLEKDLAEVRSAMRAIYTAFGASGTNISLDFLQERLSSLGSELQALNESLSSISLNLVQKPTSGNEDDRLRNELSAAHSYLSRIKYRRQELESDIADSALFVTELEERVASLAESIVAEVHLGEAVFSFCPACFTKIDVSATPNGCCTLCKSAISADSAKSQLARMRNELALQLRESNQIREAKIGELERTIHEAPAVEVRVKELEREFSRNRASWAPPQQLAIQKISREIGRKEQEIAHTAELLKLAGLFTEHTDRAGRIESEMTWIRSRIDAVRREQEGRRQRAYLTVADALKELLRGDLERQAEFQNAEDIDIDFAANRIRIDGHSQFSASSMIYLQHSFHLALLLASTRADYFRFPRFVILDGIEDGGMEPDRSFNFQRLISAESDASTAEHQIILATSQICPDLDTEQYVVGARFTHDEKSIQIS